MPSIAEIARCAGVSRCAASLILNRSKGCERFSPDVRGRVQMIADQLGWARDSRGVALQQGRTGVLALAMNWHERETGLMKSLVGAVERAASRHDRYLLIIGGPIREAVQAVQSHRCDGVLVIGWNLDPEDQAQVARCRHSVLFRVPEGLSGVELDLDAGLVRSVSHLHGLGHRRILWLHADINAGHEARWAVISRVAAKLGIACERLEFPFTAELGEESREVTVMRDALRERIPDITRFTAVICYNELVAASLYAALAGSVKIPEQLSIIGVDDIYAPMIVPPLTSVSFCLPEVAELAVTQLLRTSSRRRVERVGSALSIRESCGHARGN